MVPEQAWPGGCEQCAFLAHHLPNISTQLSYPLGADKYPKHKYPLHFRITQEEPAPTLGQTWS